MQNHNVPLSALPDGRRHLGIHKSHTYAVGALLQIILALRIFPKLHLKKERKEAGKLLCNSRMNGGNAKPNVTDKYGAFGSSVLKNN